jgi:hypothetical protein
MYQAERMATLVIEEEEREHAGRSEELRCAPLSPALAELHGTWCVHASHTGRELHDALGGCMALAPQGN